LVLYKYIAANAFIATDPTMNGDAQWVNTYLGIMGYYRDYYENPSSHVIRDRINYDIVYFAGHANYKLIETGSVAGVAFTTYDYTQNNISYVGLGGYNISNVKLMAFAGCQTSNNAYSSNIAKLAANNYGAKSSVGWTTSIENGSIITYVKNFMNGLYKGKGVQSAINYANGFSYIDSHVKNSYAWGNTSTTITLTRSMILAYNLDEERKEPVEYSVNLNSPNSNLTRSKKDNLTISVDYIIENIDSSFILNDYIVETSEIGQYITLIYAPNGIKTENSYTIYINDGSVYQISSYTEENYTDIKNRLLNTTLLKESEKENFQKTNLCENCTIENDGYKYDQTTDSIYYYIYILETNDNGAMLVTEHTYKI